MGRSIAFNKEEALNKAMFLFWDKGYDATYISDLIKTMGISRSTLYDSFGDKDQLFKLVLENYQKRGYEKKKLLFTGSNAKEALTAYFYKQIEDCYSKRTPDSCLITNSSLLIGHIDPSIEDTLIKNFSDLELKFKQVIEEGQRKGEISEQEDNELITYTLLSLNHSINLLSRYKKEKDLAYKLADKTIKAL